MDAFCSFGFICFIILLIIYSLTNQQSEQKAITKAWTEFASNTGLDVNYSNHSFLSSFSSLPITSITGDYRGFDYRLEHVVESSGDSSTSYTRITMNFPEYVGYNLRIYKESLLSKVEKVFGGQDIQVGNKEFDDSFMIKSKTPDKIDKILTPELQRKMIYGSHLINITLSRNTVENKILGVTKEAQDLLYLSEIIWEIAKNAYGKEIISKKKPKKEITDKSYKNAKGLSQSAIPKKTFQKPDDSGVTSDFTGEQSHNYEIKSLPHLEEQRLCNSCGTIGPAINKYCINCGKEM
jgi:hypothetical protein